MNVYDFLSSISERELYDVCEALFPSLLRTCGGEYEITVNGYSYRSDSVREVLDDSSVITWIEDAFCEHNYPAIFAGIKGGKLS